MKLLPIYYNRIAFALTPLVLFKKMHYKRCVYTSYIITDDNKNLYSVILCTVIFRYMKITINKVNILVKIFNVFFTNFNLSHIAQVRSYPCECK